MPKPVRTDSGDLVQPVALFAPENPATPLQGGDIPGKPIRAADGTLVTRVGIFKVEGDVAVPADKLGSDVGTDLAADPPLQMTDTGDGTGTISIDTDVSGGVPTLDQNTLIRLSQMPISGLTYHGAWDASTNSPTLADGSGTAGDFYRVSTAGTQDLGSGPLTFQVGDHVIYEGTTWQQLDPAQVIDWGDIQGTLANQADLQAALDGKVAKTGDSMSGPLTIATTASVPLSTTNTATGGAGLLSVSDNGAAVASGARLGYKLFGGATDDQHSIYHSSGAEAYASEDWAPGAAGTALRFDVTPNGTVSRGTALEIHNDGTLDVKSGKITNVADGTDPHDAVNRQQLDAKANSADVPAAADPSGQVGLAATNGSAATYLRSDAAPALDQSIAPTWTGAHEFQDATTFTAAATNADPSVEVASDNPQLELRRTSSATDEKRWNIVADPDQLSLRALNDTGDVADIAWLLTRSGATVSAHSFHVGGDAYLSISTASDIVAFVDLHMSEQRIVNLGNPSTARDAANKQYVDNAVASVGGPDTMGVQAHTNVGSVTLSAGDPRVQLCDAFGLSSPLQVTLPDNPPTGTVFTIKLAGAADQNVVISNPSATIDGQDSATLSTLNDFITVVYDGQHWQIIATS